VHVTELNAALADLERLVQAHGDVTIEVSWRIVP
jgi:hypothetical protein